MIRIFTEAGYSVGLGHLTRMRSLKNQLNDDGYPACLVVQVEDDATSGAIQLEPDETAKLWINDIEAMSSEIDPCDVVVVDTYATTEQFMKDASGLCAKLVAIDDCNRIPYHNCVVVNPNLYGEFIDYPADVNATYCLGAKYNLLRPAFRAEGEREFTGPVKRILITFGGTDVMDLTSKAVEYCHGIAPNARLDVVATTSFTALDNIKSALGENDVLHVNIDAEQMNKLMNQADFAIASAGSTSNELMITRCPSILIQVADNQEKTIRYLGPLGYFKVFEADSFNKIGEMIDPEVRKGIHDKLMELTTASSAKCLIEQLYDELSESD